MNDEPFTGFRNKWLFYSIFLVLLWPQAGFGQMPEIIQSNDVWIQKDLPQLIREALDKPGRIKSENEGTLLLVPVVASNPATGLILGVGGQYAKKFTGSDRYSCFTASGQFTSKGQKLFIVKNSIYTRGNRFYLNGDWRYLKFSQSTFGLGTDAPEGGILDYQYGLGGIETSDDSLAQPMLFNYGKFYQSISFEIS